MKITDIPTIYSYPTNDNENNLFITNNVIINNINNITYFNIFYDLDNILSKTIDDGTYKVFKSILDYSNSKTYYNISFGVDTTKYIMKKDIIIGTFTNSDIVYKIPLLVRDNNLINIDPIIFGNSHFKRIKNYIEKYLASYTTRKALITNEISSKFLLKADMSINVSNLSLNDIISLRRKYKRLIVNNVISEPVIEQIEKIEEHELVVPEIIIPALPDNHNDNHSIATLDSISITEVSNSTNMSSSTINNLLRELISSDPELEISGINYISENTNTNEESNNITILPNSESEYPF